MPDKFRKLNQSGIREFSRFIDEGARDEIPISLLSDPATSEPLKHRISPSQNQFENRFEFGQYLNRLLEDFDPSEISNDQALWTSLALRWFEYLCTPTARSRGKPGKRYRYVLSSDYRHYYRHLVRSPWQLVRDHGDNALFLLASSDLSVHGEILEQFGGRQQVLRSQSIVSAASQIYQDPRTMKPRKGVAGAGRGSARRFGLVLRQFDLTYDTFSMQGQALLDLLPSEFDRWKAN